MTRAAGRALTWHAGRMTESAALLRARDLGEAINGHPERVDAALPELAALLARARPGGPEDDAELLFAVVEALGHAYDERAALLIVPLAEAGHPDPEVRFVVAANVANGVESEPARARVSAALVRMSTDPADDVRDWACFGLLQLEAGGAEVRDALAARLDDPHLDTRSEALLALARLGDARALPVLLARLTDADDVTLLVLKAAAEWADPVLLPALEELAEEWGDDDDEHTAVLVVALRRCHPGSGGRDVALEW